MSAEDEAYLLHLSVEQKLILRQLVWASERVSGQDDGANKHERDALHIVGPCFESYLLNLNMQTVSEEAGKQRDWMNELLKRRRRVMVAIEQLWERWPTEKDLEHYLTMYRGKTVELKELASVVVLDLEHLRRPGCNFFE